MIVPNNTIAVTDEQPMPIREDGTHPWCYSHKLLTNDPSQQWVRVRMGRVEREVAQVAVRIDVTGNPVISVTGEQKMKTIAGYKGDRGPYFTRQSDYLRFMHSMIEAGKRAEFIVNDVDIFITPEED